VPSRAFPFGEGSFARPYNTALEPAAFSSRALVGATGRRGSARTLYGQSTKDVGSFFNRGKLRRFATDRGAWLLRANCAGRGRGAHSNVSISVAATSEEPEHLAAAPVGVMRVMSASSSSQLGLSNSGARPRVIEHHRFSHRCDRRGSSVAGGRAERPGNTHRSGPHGFVGGPRRSGGGSKRRRHRARFDFVQAHSRGRITSEWNRRARRSCAIMSPRRAVHSRTLYGQRKKDCGSFFIWAG